MARATACRWFVSLDGGVATASFCPVGQESVSGTRLASTGALRPPGSPDSRGAPNS
jgi:hypothetical protein